MADEAEELEIEQDETPESDEEQDGEAEVELEGEEPVEQSDDPNESAVIRDFRKREREKDKRIRELEAKTSQAQSPAQLPAEPGPRPKLEDFNWDDNKHGEALDAWIEAKGKHDAAVRDVQQQSEQVEQRRIQAYQTAKVAQPIAGIDAAEKRVFDQVPEMTRNALLHAKSPALVAVLDKYPDRLAAITETMQRDPAEALMMIGELRGKAKIMPKGRKAPNPETVVTGTARINHTTADKKQEQLEKAAQKDPSKVDELLTYNRAKRRAAKAK